MGKHLPESHFLQRIRFFSRKAWSRFINSAGDDNTYVHIFHNYEEGSFYMVMDYEESEESQAITLTPKLARKIASTLIEAAALVEIAEQEKEKS